MSNEVTLRQMLDKIAIQADIRYNDYNKTISNLFELADSTILILETVNSLEGGKEIIQMALKNIQLNNSKPSEESLKQGGN